MSQRRNVKKIKAKKPKIDARTPKTFNDNSFIDELPLKSAKEIKKERKFQKEKNHYLKKNQPEKRVVYTKKSAKELNGSLSLDILKGGKNSALIKKILFFGIAVLIIATVIIINIVTPTGIVESIQNTFASSGNGVGFPVVINGSNVLDIQNCDGNIAVLSDTNIEVYNKKSKELFTEQHGFSSAKWSVSDNRILLFNQNSYELEVIGAVGKKFSRKAKAPIMTANIGRNGTYCFVTDSDDCAAEIFVYNKNNNLMFKWKSKTDLINSVAISKSGNYLAAATLDADNGSYKTKILIFDIHSGEVVHSINNDVAVVSVLPASRNDFYGVTTEAVLSINSKTGSLNTIKTYNSLQKIYNTKYGFVTISGANDTGSKSKFTFFDGFDNDDIVSFNITSSSDGISFDRNKIVCSKDTDLYIYDFEGNLTDTLNCGFSTDKFVYIDDKIFVLNNSSLCEIEID